MTAAKTDFDTHMAQCNEAITIHKHLDELGYKADFGLRYVWVASVSALDKYVSDLIVKKATEQFSNEGALKSRLLDESIPMSDLVQMYNSVPIRFVNSSSDIATATPAAVTKFREILRKAMQSKTFQNPDKIADGLSFVWDEKHKWQKISEEIGSDAENAKKKLNAICERRNGIAHNADYDPASNTLRACSRDDAQVVWDYVSSLVKAIDKLVP